jgi:hypothetical protein
MLSVMIIYILVTDSMIIHLSHGLRLALCVHQKVCGWLHLSLNTFVICDIAL